jgi:hypothetical protein
MPGGGGVMFKMTVSAQEKLSACWNSPRQRQCQVCNDIFGHDMEGIRQTGIYLRLVQVWEELDYRFDICRVTRGAHIECL